MEFYHWIPSLRKTKKNKREINRALCLNWKYFYYAAHNNTANNCGDIIRKNITNGYTVA